MKDDRIYLGHILEAIQDIEQYTGVSHDTFATDTMRQDATIRKLEPTLKRAVERLLADQRMRG